MTDIYKLNNSIKHYEWGSSRLIPDFLGIDRGARDGKPCAEMWMGTHIFPSQIEVEEKQANLTEVSGELPFLFKLLAVEKPLSIQAHPNKTQAEEGFKREEKAGISKRSHHRNYKDTNHKPELLCAISPFTLLAGLKKTEEIIMSFEDLIFAIPQLKETVSSLLYAIETDSYPDFLRTLFNLATAEREYITYFISEKEYSKDFNTISPQQWELMKSLASLYPSDPAIISPLFLNLINLLPNQAVYIPAGILHAYMSGFGVELMTASDNVLRCGLTPKYVNIGELMSILYFVPFLPQIITAPSSQAVFNFQTPCDEYSLSIMRGHKTENVTVENKPSICLVTEGEVSANGSRFKKGESFFIKPEESGQSPVFSGDYSLFAASGGK